MSSNLVGCTTFYIDCKRVTESNKSVTLFLLAEMRHSRHLKPLPDMAHFLHIFRERKKGGSPQTALVSEESTQEAASLDIAQIVNT